MALLLPVLCLGLCACGGSGKTGTDSEAPPAEAAAPPATADAPTAPATGQLDAAIPLSDDPALQPQAAAGAVVGEPAPTNTAPIVAVANYFTDLQGFDIGALKPRAREKFLQRVNSELCTCGCKNDTLAHCYVNDARCPFVKGMIQKVYDEVKAGS